MAKLDLFISVVVPLDNAEDFLERFVEELGHELDSHYKRYEIVMVDDASSDRTVETASRLTETGRGLRLIGLSRPNGMHIAVAAGLNTVIGDYTIVMDPRSDPPSIIPDLVNRALGGAEIVYGVDTKRRRRKFPATLAARVFRWYAGRYLNLDITPNLTSLRCLSRSVLNAMNRVEDPHRYYRFVG